MILDVFLGGSGELKDCNSSTPEYKPTDVHPSNSSCGVLIKALKENKVGFPERPHGDLFEKLVQFTTSSATTQPTWMTVFFPCMLLIAKCSVKCSTKTNAAQHNYMRTYIYIEHP